MRGSRPLISTDFADWRRYLEEMLVTIRGTGWGTFVAVVLSIPFGILSSHNMVPWWVLQPAAPAHGFFFEGVKWLY